MDILVNGEIKKLEYRNDNGIDVAADFIGAFGGITNWDDDGVPIMTEGDYKWWKRVIGDHQEMDRIVNEYKRLYDKGDVLNVVIEASDVDLEDVPSNVIRALKEVFGGA